MNDKLKLIVAFLKDFCNNPVDGLKRACDIILHGATKTQRIGREWLFMRDKILSWPQAERRKFVDEVAVLKDTAMLNAFLYARVRTGSNATSGYDKAEGLPFVVHNGNRLYYTKSTYDAYSAYVYGVDVEGILGSGCLVKSPHSYVDKHHFVEDGDVVLDIGCAEALFALDSIDKASKVYLFECDKKWFKPLNATFGKFGDKVVFVRKLVSDKTSDDSIALEDAIHEPDDATFFMKMDIEGWEQTVIKASEKFLRAHKIKLSCCTYHRQEDAEVISKMLESYGFEVRFSEGYMLPCMNGIHYPYFRKGVIYARNY